MTPPALPEPALAFSFLGYALRLAEPGALRLLLAVAALGLLGAIALVRRRRALARAAGPLAPRVAPAAGVGRPAARLGLSLFGLALVALALSRPQCGTRTELTRRYGVDLAVVLDVSRSMLAADVRPDRLARAKLELAALLDGLGGDRVGLVVFAGDAFVACPLTTDHAAAKLFLRAADPAELPQGTALARALAAAREMLLASGGGAGRAKVVLVVSDGEDHEGGTASAAKALAQDGVRIFALAVGTAAGAPVPPRGGTRERAAPAMTRLDEPTLRLLADTGDGEVYDLGSADRGLAAFRAALDRMERSEVEGRLTVAYEDRYALAGFPGFLLLLAALLLREGRGPPRPAPRRAAAGASGALLALLLLGFSPFRAEEENVRAGNERLRAGDPSGARRAYDAAERAVGPHAEIEFDRAEAAAREGRLDEARAAWGRAAAAGSPALASRAHQNLGNALAAAGDREGALKAFSDALARDPTNEDARWNLEVLLRKKDEEEKRSGASGDGTGAPRAGPPPSRGGERGGQDQPRPREAEARERAGAERGEERQAERPGAERRAGDEGAAGARREPLSRQETEALLDALRARERRMPFFGRERAAGRRPDVAKDW